MNGSFAPVCFAVALIAASCANGAVTGQERAVGLTTTACGDASRTSGAGVVVDDGWVIASGHVVSGAGSVEVSGSFGQEAAEIVVFDAEADLALLRVSGAEAPLIEVASSLRGSVVELAGGGPSESAATEILRPVEVRIEAVRSTERVSRVGYEIDLRVALGDSGGGVFDAEDRLVGVVFGRTLEDVDRSFIVGRAAIERLLAADRSGSWSCDADRSRIVEIP